MKIAGGRANTPNDSFAIALPQGGTMFAGSSGAGIEIARTSNAGAVLASDFALDPNSGQRLPSAAALDLAVDGTGRAVMAAWGSDGLWLTRFAPGAVQPQTRTQVTPASSFRGPVSIALDNNGRGVIAWTQPEADRPDAPRQVWFSRLTPDGVISAPVRLLGTENLSASTPQVVTATNGVSCILWTQPDQDGAEQVAWTTVSPTGVVGPIRTMPNSADPVEFARDTQLVVGAGGSFLAVAMYVRGQNDRVNALRLMRIANDGSMLSNGDIVETPLTSSDRIDAPVLASNKPGEALVAWGRWTSTSGDCPTDDIRVSRISSDGIVSGPTVIASDIPLQCSIVPPSVALADDGTGAVGWIQGAQSIAFVEVLPPTGAPRQIAPLPTLTPSSAADVPFLAFTGPHTLSALWADSPDGGGPSPSFEVVSVLDLAGTTLPAPSPGFPTQPPGTSSEALVDSPIHPSVDGAIIDPQVACPKLELIGVRGSGQGINESHGYGSAVDTFRRSLHNTVGRTIKGSQFFDYALPYSAIAIDWDSLTPGPSYSRVTGPRSSVHLL